MKKRRSTLIVAGAALPALALALGACVVRDRGYSSNAGYGSTTTVVTESSYPERVYYREPQDPVNVYYYEASRPDVIINRHVYRESDGRTYYVERVGNMDRRFYYDDNAARNRRPFQHRDTVVYGSSQPYRESSRETVIVAEQVYPQRVHYRDSHDTTNVYYYEAQRPDVIVTRPVYREKDGRTYYVEREGNTERRLYYDDNRALRNPKPPKGRGRDKDDKDNDDKDKNWR